MPLQRLANRISTFRQLEIIRQLARDGSIGAAAESLHLTQPTVSMQLKKLSTAIGMPLYEVVGRKLKMTEAGAALAASAEKVFDEIDHLTMHLNALQGLQAGQLKLSAVTTAEYFIPHLLGPFCQRFPNIELALEVGNRSRIVDRLKENEDDCYFFSHPPEDPGLEAIPFVPNPLVVIASRKHPLAKKRKPIPWETLANEHFLVRESGSGTRLTIKQFLEQRQLSFGPITTIASNEGIKHGVMAGLGLAVVSAHTLNEGDLVNLTELNVEGFPIEQSWYCVYLRDKELSPIAKTFIEFLLGDGQKMLGSALNYWRQHRRPKVK